MRDLKDPIPKSNTWTSADVELFKDVVEKTMSLFFCLFLSYPGKPEMNLP